MRHRMMRDIPFETAVEYAVDFIELLGVPALYDEKTAVVKIKDWRGQLPCDFVYMEQVRVAPNERAKDSTGAISRFPAVYRATTHSFHLSPNKPNENVTRELTYMLQNMVIFTSTKDTDVEIAYHAFAVDEEGYPLLPDNAVFLRALEAYIKMKWFEIKFDEGTLSSAVMERADKEYTWAVGAAQSEFSRLTLDEAESLFNSFKTLLPRNNEHWRAFFTLGAKEIWKH